MTGQSDNQSVPPEPGRGRVRPGRLFELLTDSRRRQLLYYLSDEGSSQLTAVARAIARRESSTGRVPPDTVRAVYLDLYHTHLPKLADAGLVEYSDSLGEVVLVQTDDAFTRYLDAAANLEVR